MKWTEREIEVVKKELNLGKSPWEVAMYLWRNKILDRRKRGIFEKAKKILKGMHE